MTPHQLDLIRRYFETHNGTDEQAHLACCSPNLHYHGSLSGLNADGQPSYLGIWRGARRDVGVQSARPLKVYGTWPEVAVLVEITFDPPLSGHTRTEAIWRFVFGPDDRIQDLSILWTPAGPTPL